MANSSTPSAASDRRAPRFGGWALVAAVLAGALGALLLSPGTPTQADGEATSIRFLSVTGESSTTKAWYDGAPPSGSQLQEALDRFATKGYRVVGVTEPHPSTAASGAYVWNILLERK